MHRRPFRGALPVAMLLLAACITTPRRSPLQKEIGATGIPASELRVRVRALAPRFIGELELLADEVIAGSEDPRVRADMAEFKINAVTQMQRALFLSDPMGALVDTWVLIEQLDGWLQQRAPVSRAHFEAMEAELEEIWRELTAREDLAGAPALIRDWAEQHPLDSLVTRESTIELGLDITHQAGIKWAPAVAGQLVEETQDIIARVDLLAALLPKQGRWTAEAFVYRDLDGLTRDAVRAAIDEGLAAATTPENLAQLERLMRSALRSSLASAGAGGAMGGGEPRVIPIRVQGAPGSPGGGEGGQADGSLAAQLAREAGRALAQAFSEELVKQLGPEGRGALGSAASATSAQVAAAAVQGIGAWQGTLFPECVGAERAECIEEGLAQLSRTLSAGATQGVKSELSWLPVLFGFFAGVASALLVAFGWFLRGRRPERRPVGAAHPSRA